MVRSFPLSTRARADASSKVTYEEQPPGLTLLFLFDSPAAGGDTGYADQRCALSLVLPFLSFAHS